ncbi:MAG TPA: RsmG family class I SAM-dependent methyltransferase [Gaiellaceae bacterium]|nr:RsmG family class I SAM-dependent methyltransferase [Gaiellaceae bacterium]
MTDPRLERWLDELLEMPGLTSVADRDEAHRVHIEGSFAGVRHVERFAGPVVDVGSGGGSPGFPLAAALPDREVTLLEANARKASFLERVAAGFPNVRVVRGRAEEQGADAYGVAVARALAPPPVAAEWCLPLVRPGGGVVLYVGPSAELDAVARVALQVGGAEPELHDGVIVVPKASPTPAGFPRRPGMARKRPLA